MNISVLDFSMLSLMKHFNNKLLFFSGDICKKPFVKHFSMAVFAALQNK